MGSVAPGSPAFLAAQAAVKLLQQDQAFYQQPRQKLALVRVFQGTSQVVAGTIYRMDVEVKVVTCGGNPGMNSSDCTSPTSGTLAAYHVELWSKPWENFNSLLRWDSITLPWQDLPGNVASTAGGPAQVQNSVIHDSGSPPIQQGNGWGVAFTLLLWAALAGLFLRLWLKRKRKRGEYVSM